ncbi:hypothetical protein OHA88_03345 [Streptomyces sp. NBC_00353]|uniref:hypothetical protein n=1 Tax=Streptomyces sp. NBC_00353 TaxID=2975722 RepID=UPI002E262792
MEIADLTPLESRIRHTFALGEPVDARQEHGAPNRPDDQHHPNTPGPPVRATVLRGLLLSRPAEEGEIPALRLTGATVTGQLDLAFAEIPYPLRFADCDFEHAPDLRGARLRQLDLHASRLPALTATGLRVEGDLLLADCRVSGPLRLGHARVEGNISAPRLVAHGEVILEAAQIACALDLEDALLHNPGGLALNAPSLSLGTILNAGGLNADGRVRLTGTRAGGWISFIEARLHNPGGGALGISSCEARQLSLRNAEPIKGDAHYGARTGGHPALPGVAESG